MIYIGQEKNNTLSSVIETDLYVVKFLHVAILNHLIKLTPYLSINLYDKSVYPKVFGLAAWNENC